MKKTASVWQECRETRLLVAKWYTALEDSWVPYQKKKNGAIISLHHSEMHSTYTSKRNSITLNPHIICIQTYTLFGMAKKWKQTKCLLINGNIKNTVPMQHWIIQPGERMKLWDILQHSRTLKMLCWMKEAIHTGSHMIWVQSQETDQSITTERKSVVTKKKKKQPVTANW